MSWTISAIASSAESSRAALASKTSKVQRSANMGEFCIEHIKAEFIGFRHVSLAGNELEPGCLVDKSFNQPGGSDTIDVYTRRVTQTRPLRSRSEP
jgi:hypothetical protein